MQNANPIIHVLDLSNQRQPLESDWDDSVPDAIDTLEIFDLIRNINDPEHPLTLEQLNVVNMKDILVNDHDNYVRIDFTPTIPHCSMATLIGLCLRIKLLTSLPDRFKIDIRIKQGTHQSEAAVNKQLADKERVAAAMENKHLKQVVSQCLYAK